MLNKQNQIPPKKEMFVYFSRICNGEHETAGAHFNVYENITKDYKTFIFIPTREPLYTA